MKYRNAKDVLPNNLIELLQEYFQGGYLYIPKKEERVSGKARTEYKTELTKRDQHIFLKYLEGWPNKKLGSLYHLSDPSIRRIILKEKRKADKMHETVEKIACQWGWENAHIEQIYPTVWEIDHQYMIKIYEDRVGLERNIHILEMLRRHGAPVAKIVKTKDKCYAEMDGKYWLTTKKLPGGNITDIRDRDMGYKMGRTIAELHIVLQKCEKEMTFWNNSLLEEMNGWIKNVLSADEWKLVSEREYMEVVNRLDSVYDKLPKQLIHRDVHFGNFLFSDGNFSGYIDFDLSQRNIRIFDIGYFLAGLLAKESSLDVQKKEWIRIIGSVISGYESLLEISTDEKDALANVMECIEILFAAYFTDIEDADCAIDAANVFHYIREQEQSIREVCYDMNRASENCKSRPAENASQTSYKNHVVDNEKNN